jgi:streptogramin lyase
MVCLFAAGFLFRAAAADLAQTGTAGEYLVHVWQTDKGLPQNWVSSIVQTPDGYLWVGTRYGGLARFDGVRFVPFNQQNTPELKDVQVEHLDVDETGRLWIIMGNESVTAFRNGRFELFRLPRSLPRVRLDHVLNVQSNQVLFAGELPYLATVNLSASNQWNVADPRSVMDPDASTFLFDRDGVVWFVTQAKRLARFENGHFNFVTQGLPEKHVNAVAVDSARQLWIATPRHLATWDGKKFTDCTPTNGVAPDNILQISFSGDGGLWVLEKNRLRKFLNSRWQVEITSDELLGSAMSGSSPTDADSCTAKRMAQPICSRKRTGCPAASSPAGFRTPRATSGSECTAAASRAFANGSSGFSARPTDCRTRSSVRPAWTTTETCGRARCRANSPAGKTENSQTCRWPRRPAIPMKASPFSPPMTVASGLVH